MCIKGFVYHLCHDSHLGCVRLGNSDLDFEIRISDFAIEHELRKWISLPRNLSPGWISIKKSKPDFMDFLFTVRLGNPKKDLQNYSREQWSSFYKLACTCKTAFLKNSLSNPFSDTPKEQRKFKNRYLSVEILFRISVRLQTRNPDFKI